MSGKSPLQGDSLRICELCNINTTLVFIVTSCLARRAFIFFLDKKTKQKNQVAKNAMLLCRPRNPQFSDGPPAIIPPIRLSIHYYSSTF